MTWNKRKKQRQNCFGKRWFHAGCETANETASFTLHTVPHWEQHCRFQMCTAIWSVTADICDKNKAVSKKQEIVTEFSTSIHTWRWFILCFMLFFYMKSEEELWKNGWKTSILSSSVSHGPLAPAVTTACLRWSSRKAVRIKTFARENKWEMYLQTPCLKLRLEFKQVGDSDDESVAHNTGN